MLQSNIASALSAIALGGALGFVLQRGRFCLNSAFRDIIFMKDLTMFRSYLLAVVVAIVGANFLEEMKMLTTVHPETGAAVTYGLLRQNLMPAAHIIGGFLFGIGKFLLGGRLIRNIGKRLLLLEIDSCLLNVRGSEGTQVIGRLEPLPPRRPIHMGQSLEVRFSKE